MGTIQHVGKWGSSLAVRIPKAIAAQCKIVEGASVQLDAYGDVIVIRKRTYDLATIVDQIASDNIHHEQGIWCTTGQGVMVTGQ